MVCLITVTLALPNSVTPYTRCEFPREPTCKSTANKRTFSGSAEAGSDIAAVIFSAETEGAHRNTDWNADFALRASNSGWKINCGRCASWPCLAKPDNIGGIERESRRHDPEGSFSATG